MREVRRDDGELCGFVMQRGGRWRALTVFSGQLADFDDENAAAGHVLRHGLASLAERWELRGRCEDEWRIVCILEANPYRVRLALDYYSLPGVPTADITVDELRSGEWELRRR